MVQYEFFIAIIDSASNINEYQEYFLGGPVWCWQLYHLLVPIILKSGQLVEPSGRVQACSGAALPLRYYFLSIMFLWVANKIEDVNTLITITDFSQFLIISEKINLHF